MRRIKREHFVPTKNSYVCSLHFVQTDFKNASSDSNRSRKRIRSEQNLERKVVRPEAVPSVFSSLPSLSIVTPVPRSTIFSSSTSRLNRENNVIINDLELFQSKDAVKSFEELTKKVASEIRNFHLNIFVASDTVSYSFLQLNATGVTVKSSVVIYKNLNFDVYINNIVVPKESF